MLGACPKCRTIPLAPVEGQLPHPELPESMKECPSCGGFWLPHVVIEQWSEHPSLYPPDDEPVSRLPDADHRTGLCPTGHGILIRARVQENPPFYLERCAHCRGVWLDRGEWHRLVANDLWAHLDDLWDPTWRKRSRVEEGQKQLDRALEEALGPRLFGDLAGLINQLRRHPARAQALAWLTAHLED